MGGYLSPDIGNVLSLRDYFGDIAREIAQGLLAVAGGRPPTAADFGISSIVFNAAISNNVAVPHRLGHVPAAIVLTPGSTDLVMSIGGNPDGSQFQAVAFSRSGAALTSSYTFHWIALG